MQKNQTLIPAKIKSASSQIFDVPKNLVYAAKVLQAKKIDVAKNPAYAAKSKVGSSKNKKCFQPKF